MSTKEFSDFVGYMRLLTGAGRNDAALQVFEGYVHRFLSKPIRLGIPGAPDAQGITRLADEVFGRRDTPKVLRMCLSSFLERSDWQNN